MKQASVSTGNKQALTEKLLYTLVWSCVLLIPILNAVMFRRAPFDWNTIQVAWGTVMPYLLLFFIHNSLIAPRLLIRRRYLLYVCFTFPTVAAIFFAVFLYQYAIGIGPNDAMDEVMGLDGKVSLTNLSFGLNLLLGIFLCGLNAAIKLIFKSLRDEQIMEVLQRNTLQAELDYLKYQINPHFFMNTLNNIHALIDIDTEAAKDTVIELSKMMRYVLYDSERDRIAVEQEIRFLNHYIKLMRLRYTDRVQITFTTPAVTPERFFIPPLILIVFVENAFKHGVSYNHPSFIRIEIGVEQNDVICRVVNSRHKRDWQKEGGIGLDNVRKRLELIYASDYRLDISQSEETYRVELKIPSL